MNAKYKGRVGPASAMDALEPSFNEAYIKATEQMMAAVIEFEKTTGRIADNIELQVIDVTTFSDKVPKHIRNCSMHFLPKPGEVEW